MLRLRSHFSCSTKNTAKKVISISFARANSEQTNPKILTKHYHLELLLLFHQIFFFLRRTFQLNLFIFIVPKEQQQQQQQRKKQSLYILYSAKTKNEYKMCFFFAGEKNVFKNSVCNQHSIEPYFHRKWKHQTMSGILCRKVRWMLVY